MQATEIVLPGIGEPEALQLRTRGCRRRDRAGVGPGGGHRGLVRRAADAPREVLRPAAVPFVPGYDLVGDRGASRPRRAALGRGARVAALTKTGGWADRVVLEAPTSSRSRTGVDPAAAETVIVNGMTAWRMLHRSAGCAPGETSSCSAPAAASAPCWSSSPRHAGAAVIGTAGPAQLDRVSELGAGRSNYRAEDVPARVRSSRPGRRGGVRPRRRSGHRRVVADAGAGGTLVSYGTAATRDIPGNPRLPVLALLGRLMLWNPLPNGRHATFFNLWAGKRRRARYRDRLREDLGAVLALLRDGAIEAQVDRNFALTEAAAALRHAEAGGLAGKVVLVP